MEEARFRHTLPLALLCCLVFAYICVFVLPNNIHDDGMANGLLAKEIATTGDLLEHRPYHVMDASGGEVQYMPIAYPQTSHLAMALFYLIGEETFLEFFSPLFAVLTALFVYLLLSQVNRPVAFLAALVAVVINTDRFTMVPLVEQPLLALAVMSLYFYHRLLRTRQVRYVLLTALFLGLCVASKQQGLLVLATILSHGVCVAVYEYVKRKDLHVLKLIMSMLAVVTIIAFIPLFDQVDRNGTLDYVPGESALPFLESNFPVDPEAEAIHEELIGYWPSYSSVFGVLKQYFLYPIRYTSGGAGGAIAIALLCLVSVCLVFSVAYLYGRDRALLSILLLVLLAEVIVTYLTDTPVHQYHVVGLSVYAILLVAGLRGAWGAARPWVGKRLAVIGAAALASALIAAPLVIYYPPWDNSGRYNDYYLEAFSQMGAYARENTPEDALFIAANEGFMYYAERDALWLNEGGGAKVPLIFSTDDESEALLWIRDYGVDYVFIDMRQLDRAGLFDYIPGCGLLDYIDSSSHFQEVCSVRPDGEALILYRIIW